MLTRSLAAIALVTAGCGPVALAGSDAAYAPETFSTLPDVSVCVVDRTADSGLRELAAKRSHDGRTLLIMDGAVVPLEDVHAPGVAAGYAAGEPWLMQDTIAVDGRSFVKVRGERRIEAAQITRVGEFRQIPVFASTGDAPPPDAIYLPTRPGCVFQAYIRADLR